MNKTVLFTLLLLNSYTIKEEVIENLANDAFNSPLHSIRQIYRVNDRGDAEKHFGELLPTINLEGVCRTSWPIENAMIVVRTTESSFGIVLENLSKSFVDVEKVFVVVDLDLQGAPNRLELAVEAIGQMLFRRGILNYCVLSATTATLTESSTVSLQILHSLQSHNLRTLFSDNFPYAYKLGHSWEGNDVYLLSLAKDRFRCRVDRAVMNINRANALSQMETVQTELENGRYDLHIPRAHYTRKNTGVRQTPAHEWESLVLVVPKSDQLNLGNIMLQPFSVEVWTMVCVYLLTRQCFKVVSFLKRKYTRLRPRDPQTLEEFFHSDIRVVIPEYMDPLVTSFEPYVATQLQAKMVRPQEFAKLPASCCARIHTLQRAEYIIRTQKYWDKEVGRRQLYILPRSLSTISMSYLLGPNFSFQTSFEQFILHVSESGLMAQYIRTQREFLALLERNYVSKGWLTLVDLFPLFLLLICGWCLSLMVFGLEYLSLRVSRYIRRNNVRQFK
ncbi:AGAP006407-PA-like protein [Anopheles sinensis]|uniref:AGAP006407-PA-like protein n=1 Tax=Anopheles sinensis TaxID=74873 RepID=A0A084VDG3_ANOSI|nr:AGAP006407-PA-like protein [Anopheles sinensis]